MRFFTSLLIFLFAADGTTQEIPQDFERLVDSLTQEGPRTYAEINPVMRRHKSDTLLMRYFSDFALEKNYMPGLAYALNELGRVYRNTSQYDKAIAFHEEALDLAEKIRSLEFKVASLNDLGVVYRRTSSIRAAMDYNQQALELAETVKNPSNSLKKSINVSYNCIGLLYLLLKQYDEAIFYFKKSLKLEGELGNKRGLAINYQNIGKCLEQKGELDQALKNYRTSLAYNQEIDNDMGLVICNTSIAQVYLKQKLVEDGANFLEAILPKAKEMGDGFLIAPVYMNLGWSQILDERLEEAEVNLLESLKIADSVSLRETSARTNQLLAQLYQKKQEFEKALDYTVKAKKIEEEILNENTIRYVNDIIYRYDSEKQNAKISQYQTELRARDTTLLISGIALALLAGIFYILYRQYQLKNEKKLLTLEQSMLRSQMNPHFLFNSLNSIKLYIINNEQKNAVHYLNKFSKLVRKILESSSMREIPLAEELETVELYMNIENIRFSNEIDFQIRLDNTIDPHTIKIPSLILQPFLENALWHGLSSKVGDKKIDLHISKEGDDFIHIAIADNGIGREAAEKIKRNKVLKRKSVGIEITKERLANFSKDFQNSFDVEIVDLYDSNKKAIGTKFILHIPTA